MERDNYNPYNFESSGESSDEKKNDKKKSKSAESLGRLVAREERKHEESPKSETSASQKAEEVVDDNHETDQEVPLETVSADEQVEVAEAHIGERSKELVAESEGDQTQEQAAETVANAAFLDAVQERLATSNDVTVEEAIEGAYDEITTELGVEGISPSPEEDLPFDEQADAGELDLEAEPQDLDPDHAVPLAAGGGTPPTPPVLPRQSQASPAGGGVPHHTPPAVAPGTNGSEAPNRLNSADAAYYERRGVARGLLVGGVVGYLIGRRRGRIKTEKRMQVVQQKLEKQVSEIHQKIEQKELVIRKLARQNVSAAVGLAPRLAERVVRGESRPAEVSANNKASIVHGSAERLPTPERAGTVKAIERVETAKAAVDNLSKEELLAYSAQIRVGETNLRRVFEANMVDEKGLRRLIKEYQAGHDLRRALAREFMVKELKFERDPTLRDLLPPEARPRRQGKSNEGQNQYGEGAATAMVDHIAEQIAAAGKSSEILSPAAMAARASQAKRRQANVSSGVLVGLTLVTIGLAIYAVWLTLSK